MLSVADLSLVPMLAVDSWSFAACWEFSDGGCILVSPLTLCRVGVGSDVRTWGCLLARCFFRLEVEPPWYDSLALQALHFADESPSSSKYNHTMLLFSDFRRLPLLELGWDILRSFTEWVVRIPAYSDTLITLVWLLSGYSASRPTGTAWGWHLLIGCSSWKMSANGIHLPLLPAVRHYHLSRGPCCGLPTPVMAWTELLYLYW